MKKCEFINQVDNYLLDKLNEKEKEVFEKHFFNCHICSTELILRGKIVEIIKEKGSEIFSDVILQIHAPRRTFSLARFAYFFRVQKWAYAFLILFILVLGGGIYLSYKLTHPPFLPPSGEVLRGEILTLLSPHGEIQESPSIFLWEKNEDSSKYIFSLYDRKGNLLWEAKTKNNKIKLPSKIRILLKKGDFYFWEVKALSSQGSIIAQSRRAIFRFIKPLSK